MLRKSIIILLSIFLVVGIGLTGCSFGTEEESRIVIGILADVETLNPILSAGAVESDIMNGIFSTLLKVNEHLGFEPDLLKKMPQISSEGLIYSFTLREGVKFHDGVEVTAKDVKFLYEMMMDENNIVANREMWENIEEFKILDDYNFEITLKERDVTWMENWAYAHTMIVPKHILEEEFLAGDGQLTKGGEFSREPVGSGPYEIVEWKPTEYIMLQRNEDYYRGTPEINTILFKVIPDSNTMFAQFVTGDIDLYNRAQPNHYSDLIEMQGEGSEIVVHKYSEFVYTHADFNLRLPVFQDKAVRQALNYAFPKEDFIDTVLDGIGSPAYSYIPPMSWAYNPGIKTYEYNPDKAVQLLEEAGWHLGEDGVRVKEDLRLEFTINTTSGDRTREQFQEIAKQAWEDIGAQVHIENYEPGTLFGDILMNLKFDMILFAWSSGFDPDGEALWHSKQRPDVYGTGQNFVGYVNEHLDNLLTEGKKEAEQEKRKEIYHEVQEILAEDVPSLFIYFNEDIVAVPGNLQNFRPNPTQAGNTWNIYEWKLK